MSARLLVALLFALAQPLTLAAQSTTNITGAWVPMTGGRGVDPKLAPPPARPIVLTPEYAPAWEARRQAEAEATKMGEPPASAAVLCTPYGMPRMMSVATYPVEILQTPGQITMVTEAFSVTVRPMRGGTPGGLFVSITLPDGRVLGERPATPQ